MGCPVFEMRMANEAPQRQEEFPGAGPDCLELVGVVVVKWNPTLLYHHKLEHSDIVFVS